MGAVAHCGVRFISPNLNWKTKLRCLGPATAVTKGRGDLEIPDGSLRSKLPSPLWTHFVVFQKHTWYTLALEAMVKEEVQSLPLTPQTSQELCELHSVLQLMSHTKYIQTEYGWNCMLTSCVLLDLLSSCAKIV